MSYSTNSRQWLLVTMLVVVCVTISSIAHALWRTADPTISLGYLFGKRFFCVPERLHVGAIACGSTFEVELRFRNFGNRAVTVLGAQKSCGCIELGEFPISVPARSSKSLVVKLQAPTRSKEFDYSVAFFSDEEFVAQHTVEILGFAS
jgi:hypothetical protein